ncbi:hypothetical protein HPP92_013141 [Vanilla planifolia]|uniref:Uncharacterized protein n=1 Tax=Vanilla planifolia TaxID=51239 RepID=A0A835R2Z1_VANPL|nr:hypothetical protein HPP92_013141 [Vanilla planifolia]
MAFPRPSNLKNPMASTRGRNVNDVLSRYCCLFYCRALVIKGSPRCKRSFTEEYSNSERNSALTSSYFPEPLTSLLSGTVLVTRSSAYASIESRVMAQGRHMLDQFLFRYSLHHSKSDEQNGVGDLRMECMDLDDENTRVKVYRYTYSNKFD